MPTLHTKFPWLKNPLILNAPMGGIAGPALAVAVSRAGGLGLMGMDPAGSKIDPWLDEATQSFRKSPIYLSLSCENNTPQTTADLPYLPIGIGFLVTFMKLELVLQKLQARTEKNDPPPAVIWLFAANEPSTPAYTTWANAIRKLYAGSKYTPQIWIQVGGSAKAAVELVTSAAAPDAIVIQGSDAGGHGMERGASLIGLLPETLYLLKQQTDRQPRPHILASGGIVDSSGALAALALGAEGVVMGTRFLASPETTVHPEYQKRVLAATDGAQSTIRAKVFDELSGPNIWPVTYDGRALVSQSWRDLHDEKISIETIRDGHAKAVKGQDCGFGLESDRAAIWCGTGVGLVNELKPAADVVVEVRNGVKALMEEMQRRILDSKL